MIPGSDPLENRKHEAFALAVACEGLSYAEAYREKVSNKGTMKTSQEKGSKLASSVKVEARICFLKGKVTEKARSRAASAVLTKADKLAFLARIVNVRGAEIDEEADGDLINGVTFDQFGNRVLKIPDKLAALKIHNDLAEEGAEASALSGLLARVTGWGHRE